MDAILKQNLEQNEVFIYATGLKDEVKNDPSFIIKTPGYGGHTHAYLYGNRVYIEMSSHTNSYVFDTFLIIDGIKILTPIDEYGTEDNYVTNDNYGAMTGSLSIEKLVAYLNQINALGVDYFLEIYKKAMQEFKEEMSVQAEKYEASLAMKEDDALRKILMTIKKTLLHLSFLILALSIYMPIGLDNHIYTEAYEHVINLYQK